MKSTINVIIIATIALFNSSCEKNDNSVICTTEFVTIKGTMPSSLKLDKYHTIRLATGDTLKLDSNWRVTNDEYPLINDSFKFILRGKIESFRFQGFIKDSLVANKDFKVTADECHVKTVRSGME